VLEHGLEKNNDMGNHRNKERKRNLTATGSRQEQRQDENNERGNDNKKSRKKEGTKHRHASKEC